MGHSTFLKLTAVCLASAAVPSAMALSAALDAAQAVGLLERASDSCGGVANYTQCGQGLPDSFCCGPDTTCFPFNGGKSSICCPSGRSCDSLLPVPCRLETLNATLFPTNPVHSTDLATSMLTCGSACCPVGYTCNSNNGNPLCDLVTATNASSSVSSTASSATATSTATSAPASVPTSNPFVVSSPSQPTNAATSCTAFPIPAILVGFFPGLVAGILTAVLFTICFGRRHPPNRDSSESSSFGPLAAKISDPIYHGTIDGTRNDFLRRDPASRGSLHTPDEPTDTFPLASRFSMQRTSRVRSLFHKSPSLRGGAWGGPRTPNRGPAKQPSMESITIYSPPDHRRHTTFGDVLAAAGEPQTPPPLPRGGLANARSRGVGVGR